MDQVPLRIAANVNGVNVDGPQKRTLTITPKTTTPVQYVIRRKCTRPPLNVRNGRMTIGMNFNRIPMPSQVPESQSLLRNRQWTAATQARPTKMSKCPRYAICHQGNGFRSKRNTQGNDKVFNPLRGPKTLKSQIT